MLRQISSDIDFFVEHLYIAISKKLCPDFSFFLFWLLVMHPKGMCRSYFFLKFEVLREGSSANASFAEQPVHSIFKMYSVLILVAWFWFATVYPRYMFKFPFFFWKFRCFAKEAVLLFLSWSNLCVVFSKCIMFWL